MRSAMMFRLLAAILLVALPGQALAQATGSAPQATAQQEDLVPVAIETMSRAALQFLERGLPEC